MQCVVRRGPSVCIYSFTASPSPPQNSPNFISDAPLSDITESSNSDKGCEDDEELLEDLIDNPSTANRLA